MIFTLRFSAGPFFAFFGTFSAGFASPDTGFSSGFVSSATGFSTGFSAGFASSTTGFSTSFSAGFASSTTGFSAGFASGATATAGCGATAADAVSPGARSSSSDDASNTATAKITA